MVGLSILINLVACVPDTTLLSEVTDEQAKSLCLEQGAEREYKCEDQGMSITYTFGYEDESDCDDEDIGTFPDNCDATVGDSRACTAALETAAKDDPCITDTPSECEALYSCLI